MLSCNYFLIGTLLMDMYVCFFKINFIYFNCIVVGSHPGGEHSASGPTTPGTRDDVPGMNMIVLNSRN